MENIKLKKVTCTFYTVNENIESVLKEELLTNNNITTNGLFNITEKNIDVKFNLKDDYIVICNNNYSNPSHLFNIDELSDEILNSPSKQMEFRNNNGLYKDYPLRKYMPYKMISHFGYTNGRRDRVVKKSYDDPRYIYNVKTDEEEIGKRKFTDGIDAYKIYMRKFNGELVGYLEPVEPSFYLKYIDYQPSNILSKFLSKKLGTEDQYNNKEFINSIVDKFETTIKRLIKEKNQSSLCSILKILVNNSINNYRKEYKEKYNDEHRYPLTNDVYTLPKDIYMRLVNLIKPTLSIRTISSLLKEILSKNYSYDSVHDILNSKNNINKISLTEFMVRDIVSGTKILPKEYEDFLFNQEHITNYEKAKARAIRTILIAFNFRGLYVHTLANSTWNLEMCRSCIVQLNSLLLSNKDTGLKLEYNDFKFNYSSYEYDIDKNLLLFNHLTEDELDDVLNVIKHIFKLFFINKELTDQICSLETSLFKAGLNHSICEKLSVLLLEVLEESEGRETSTVKSLIKNGVVLGTDNIFNNLDNKYTKLREIKMRTILQK